MAKAKAPKTNTAVSTKAKNPPLPVAKPWKSPPVAEAVVDPKSLEPVKLSVKSPAVARPVVDGLYAKITELGNAKDALGRELIAEQNRCIQLTHDIAAANSKIASVTAERDGIAAERDRATGDLSALNKLYTDERDARRSLAATVGEQDRELVDLRSKLTELGQLRGEKARLIADASAAREHFDKTIAVNREEWSTVAADERKRADRLAWWLRVIVGGAILAVTIMAIALWR